MNKAFVFGLALTFTALVALTAWFGMSSQRHTALLEKLSAENKAKSTQLDLITKKNEELSREIKTLKESELARGEVSLQAAPSAADTSKPKKTHGMGMLEGMMKDPEMKQMIQDQQANVIRNMYQDLFKTLKLTPEQEQSFIDVMVDESMKAMNGVSGFGGKLDGKAIEKSHAEKESKMKALLGTDGFTQYEEYSKSLSSRMLADQFRGQLSSTSTPLQEVQRSQLMQIMREEDAKVIGSDGKSPGKLMTPEGLALWSQQQQQSYQKVVERAATVLTPEQNTSLAKFLENQLNMKEMGLKMAQKWMNKSPEGN